MVSLLNRFRPPDNIRRFPLLRRLLLLQVAALLIGLALVLALAHFAGRTALDASIRAKKTVIEDYISTRQEQWRAWSALDMNDVLAEDIAVATKKLAVSSIELIPYTKASTADPYKFTLPRTPAVDLSQPVVEISLNADQLDSPYRIDRINYYMLFSLVALVCGLILYSMRFIQNKIYRPFLTIVDSFETGQATSATVEESGAEGEVKDVLRLLTNAHDRVQKAETATAQYRVARQVAHDLKSPLSAIAQNAERIAATLAAGNPSAAKEAANLVMRAAGRVNEIASEISEKYRIVVQDPRAPGHFNEERRLTIFQPLLQQAVAEKRIQISSSIELYTEGLEATLHTWCEVQIGHLQTAFSNIIENAIEAIPEGKEGRIEIIVGANDNNISIAISDNGVGIPADKLSEVTRQGVTFGKRQGSGLGLYQADTAIKGMNGELAILSQEGIGTTISITIPRAPTPAYTASEILITPPKTIFVIDDNQWALDEWKTVLSKHSSLNVTYLPTVERAKDHNLVGATIIADHQFGDKPLGLDFLLCASAAGARYLATTSYASSDLQEKLKQSSGILLIPKPWIPSIGVTYA